MQNDEKGGNAAAVQRVTSGHEGNLTAGFKELRELASRGSGGTPGGWKGFCKLEAMAWWNAAGRELGEGRSVCNRDATEKFWA